MAQNEFEVSDWVNRLAGELNILTQSVTASRINMPTLTNEQYRNLANQAAHGAEVKILFEEYIPELNSDITNAIELLRTHPIVQRELAGSNDDSAIMMITPRGSSRADWNRLVRRLVRSAIKGDGHRAANKLHKYLTLSDEKRLPGYEITLFRGLKVEGRIKIGRGAFIASYDDIVKCGLLKAGENVPWDDHPDYRNKDVSALVRHLKWGPGITPPLSGSNIGPTPKVTFPYLDNRENLGIIFDFLSIVTRQELEILSVQFRGAKFMEDIDANFPAYAVTAFSENGMRRGVSPRKDALSVQEVSAFREFIHNWINASSNLKIDLAVRRLASSVSRKGRFRLQDSILDVSIALEIMYELDDPGLTYKLSTRAGYFLGTDAERRIEIYDKVSKFYNARSYIVHGERKRKRPDLEQAFVDGYDLARSTLSELLCQKNKPEWKELVMGDRQQADVADIK